MFLSTGKVSEGSGTMKLIDYEEDMQAGTEAVKTSYFKLRDNPNLSLKIRRAWYIMLTSLAVSCLLAV